MCAAQPSWREQGFPAFDTDPDGFPCPGQVIRHFRQTRLKADGKPWTQCDVAQVLGKQELAVREMELRGIGLNAITRRRLLAEVFDIPQILLGLVTVPEGQDTSDTAPLWWVQQGFPAFDAGSDGFPRVGQVIRYFRQRKLKADGKPWTQRDVAQVLGKQELAMRDMELRDTGLNDISRRRFLAQLFEIPPVLLGLATLPQQERVNMQAAVSPAKMPTLIKLSQERLSTFRTEYYTRDGQETLADAARWITYLDSLKTSARASEVEALLTLQSDYGQLIIDIGREMQNYKKVLSYASKAVSFAEQTDNHDLIALALLRRSEALREYGNAEAALTDIDKALLHTKHASATVKGMVLADAGRLHAEAAQDTADRTYAQNLFEQAGHIARTMGVEEDPHFVKYNLGIYHMRKADGLLALHQAKLPTRERPLDELQLAERETSPEMTRRLLVIEIIGAQAYLQAKEYDQALDSALHALEGARQIKSRINRDRVETIYHALSRTGADSVNLARLGWMLQTW